MFGDQLKKYREKYHFTQKDLAYRVELITGRPCRVEHISGYERGTNPKVDTIEAIAEVLDIPVQYLFDDSNRAINKIIDKEIPSFQSFTEHTTKVPLLDGYVGAGSAGYIPEVGEQNVIDYLYVDNYMIKKAYRNKPVSGLVVIGDSMRPYVDDSDIVLFSELDRGQYRMNDGKYIIDTINGRMVKNLRFKTNGDIVISSCNKIYSEEVIKAGESQESIDIVGVVVGRILKS